MQALNDPRREAFARGLAEGLSPLAAYGASGFASKRQNRLKSAKLLSTRNDIVARADELRQDMDWGATPDITRIINELAWLSQRARAMESPAALAAARGILAEVAKLKGRLGEAGDGPAETTPPAPPMSNAEWLAAYAPKR